LTKCADGILAHGDQRAGLAVVGVQVIEVEPLQQAAPAQTSPQSATVRRLQHDLARQANLYSLSHGKEPNRRVRIYRGTADEGNGQQAG
jgi:hypothetical protein